MKKIITQNDIKKAVRITKSGAKVHSIDVARIFGKSHDNILRMIRDMEFSLLKIEESVRKYFVDSAYINSRGKKYPRFELTRKGFDLVVLSLTGQNALKYKVWFIDEFHNKQASIDSDKTIAKKHKEVDFWIEFRDEGKIHRKELTDAIVKYDVPLGVQAGKDESNFTKLRMMNYSRLINSVLNITTPKGTDTRNVVDARTLLKIESIEIKIASLLEKYYCEKDMTYKELYQKIKKEIS